MSSCQIAGCRRESFLRGWCRSHYRRWLRHGDPLAGRTPLGLSLAERVAWGGRPEDRGHDTPCLVAIGKLTPKGYATICAEGMARHRHTVAWELAHGPVPTGMQLHHLCRQKDCFAVHHLALRTPLEHAAEHRSRT